MFMFNIQNKNQTIRFDRQPNGKITTDSSIEFIKFIRSTFNTSLRDTKDFHDNFMRLINAMTPTEDVLRNRLIETIQDIHNTDDLMDILGFAQTTIDHPKTNSESEWNRHYRPAKMTIEELDRP